MALKAGLDPAVLKVSVNEDLQTRIMYLITMRSKWTAYTRTSELASVYSTVHN